MLQNGETKEKSRDPNTGLFTAVQKAQPLAEHGGSRCDVITPGSRGTSQPYLLRRLARDAPDVLERVKTGEIKSARAAAIEAGIITPFPSLQLKDPAPTAQKLLIKKSIKSFSLNAGCCGRASSSAGRLRLKYDRYTDTTD